MTTAMLVPEVAKAVLVCKYFPSSSCILTASGVLLLPGPVIIVLDNIKCTLEVMNKEVPRSSAHANCSSKTRVWDYLTQCGR